MTAEPSAFGPAVGGWGRKGWTLIHLSKVSIATGRRVLEAAWRNVAPKRLIAASKSV